ncbi:MAG TPA: DUF1415 domain-containing protein [Gammaproteobacteria bacterium]|nr:DUF1415 domain-containing protein [Gammaproteobacteria bacterium]
MKIDAAQVVDATREWLEKAVIGLRLCPFAERAYAQDQIRYRVSVQESAAGLSQELAEELEHLHAADPLQLETSLLIHPRALGNFDDYNQFLDEADATVAALGLEGEIQVASFHPAYRFAGTAPNAVENYTNRSPYPMLHLLREASVTRAVESFNGVHEIGANNIATLNALGEAGWRRLWEPKQR